MLDILGTASLSCGLLEQNQLLSKANETNPQVNSMKKKGGFRLSMNIFLEKVSFFGRLSQKGFSQEVFSI
jgi:hypothetical protein